MAALNINTHYNCETCEAADKYGRGCRHGLMFSSPADYSGS